MHDGSIERVQSCSWKGGDAEVTHTREEFIHQPQQASMPGQCTGREPSGSFACKTRLGKYQHRNHKGEDEAVFPEKKQRFLPKAEVRALLFFFQ